MYFLDAVFFFFGIAAKILRGRKKRQIKRTNQAPYEIFQIPIDSSRLPIDDNMISIKVK